MLVSVKLEITLYWMAVFKHFVMLSAETQALRKGNLGHHYSVRYSFHQRTKRRMRKWPGYPKPGGLMILLYLTAESKSSSLKPQPPLSGHIILPPSITF